MNQNVQTHPMRIIVELGDISKYSMTTLLSGKGKALKGSTVKAVLSLDEETLVNFLVVYQKV